MFEWDSETKCTLGVWELNEGSLTSRQTRDYALIGMWLLCLYTTVDLNLVTWRNHRDISVDRALLYPVPGKRGNQSPDLIADT